MGGAAAAGRVWRWHCSPRIDAGLGSHRAWAGGELQRRGRCSQVGLADRPGHNTHCRAPAPDPYSSRAGHRDEAQLCSDGSTRTWAGIVQGLSEVRKMERKPDDFLTLTMGFPAGKMADITMGASVAINGTCLTVRRAYTG